MNEFVETILDLPWHEPKHSYDVVIVGGGGHGLATAYYLATRHGSRTWRWRRPTTSGRATAAGTRPSSGPTTGSPSRCASTSTPSSCTPPSRRRPSAGSCIRPRASSGWPTPSGAPRERARALLNQACGAETVMVTPRRRKSSVRSSTCPAAADTPVLGASYHPGAATARHDRVVWAYARARCGGGTHILQHTPVIGLLRDGDRVTGVQTDAGPISAGVVLLAVGGRVTQLAAMADVRLPIRTHPLQALVTNAYAQGFGPIVSDSELLCYVSQTARGQMLMGAEFDSQPSYSMASSFEFLQSGSAGDHILPFLRDLRVLRQMDRDLRHLAGLLADHGSDRGRRPVGHHRLGDVGFQGHPGRRRGHGRAHRHRGDALPDFVLRAGPIRPRPRHGRSGIGGDALMLWLTCPTCGERPVTEFRFGGELRPRAGPPDR